MIKKLIRATRFNTSPQNRLKYILEARPDLEKAHEIISTYFPDDQRFVLTEEELENPKDFHYSDGPEVLYLTGRTKLFLQAVRKTPTFIADNFIIDPITLKDCPKFRLHPFGCLKWMKIHDEIDDIIENLN